MNGLDIRLDGVSMRFGAFTAVQPTDLTVKAGEFFSILGPSGCGKTTLLRLIAGFETPTTGAIAIGGVDMARVPPNQRPTALVFQNLALFPLMSVRENVAFGLEARKVAKAERHRRADQLLELVALTGQGDKPPGQLSGGQRQRVAIARALAVEPGVLLLDEPLSALDLKLRQHMRAELRAIQKRTGVTFLYITHDQGEALAMSDRVAVMDHGRVEQVGAPQEIYAEPRSLFVARFVGEQNEFTGRIVTADGPAVRVETPLGTLGGRLANGRAPEGAVTVCIRPERVRLDGAGETRLPAVVRDHAVEGALVISTLDVGEHTLIASQTNTGALPPPGTAITVALDAADLRVF